MRHISKLSFPLLQYRQHTILARENCSHKVSSIYRFIRGEIEMEDQITRKGVLDLYNDG